MFKKLNPVHSKLIDQNRLLIITPFDNKIIRPSKETTLKRNKLIAELSDKLFIPYANPTGNIYQIKNKYVNKIIST